MFRNRDLSWWPAAVFAVVFEAVMLGLGYLLTGPPTSMAGSQSFKATPTVGIPSLDQLLDGMHQPHAALLQNGGLLSAGLVWTILTFFLYTIGNVFYISMLFRQVRAREGSTGDDVKRSSLTLFGWMLVQFGLSLLTMPIITMAPILGGLVVFVFLLWFRYHFLFLEYTAVILRRPLAEAWKLSPQIRKGTDGQALSYFFWTIAVNLVLGYLVNLLFSWPVVLLLLVVNAFLLTALQRNLLDAFYNSVDRLKFENWQP